MNSFQKGSEWRRWDLHLHTPETKLSDSYTDDGDVWDKYVKVLEQSPVEAFGITDYFSADSYFSLITKYKEKYPETKKVFFPNLEFRLNESISKDHKNPHIHVIFSNDPVLCSQEKINTFLGNLETYQEDENGVTIKCSDLKTTENYNSATVSLKNIKKSLDKTFGKFKPYLIAFPAKNDGVRSTDNNSPRKILITDQIDRDSSLFFGGADSTDFFLSETRYSEGEALPKPVVSCSDAHSFDDLDRLEGNVAGFLPTWIKADLTFRGLKQICFEPAGRVFIGFEPTVEQRKTNQATKFISSLNINQIENYDESNGQWFKDVKIPISPELTVIIGNKGSGKSALVDIIGLLGDSRQNEYFSFLSDKGSNKKFKQRGYAENYEAKLEWQSSKTSTKNLDDNVDISKPETVRYLPQNYFEQLTNEIEIEEFQKKIEDVVFSHVEETERMGKSSFSDLQELKTQQNKQETSVLKAKLRELNIEIIDLEEQANPLYKEQLKEKLKSKKDELESLTTAKPKEVQKLEQETDEQKKLSKKIEEFSKIQLLMENKGKEVVETLSSLKGRLQRLNSLLSSISSLKNTILGQTHELKPTCEELGIDIDQVIKSQIDTSPIDQKITDTQNTIKSLELSEHTEFNDNFTFSDLKSLPDLRGAYKYIEAQISILKEQLGAPQRKYQNYLEKLSKWNSQINDISGNESDPQSGTIKDLESKISYIEKDLTQKLSEKNSERHDTVKSIFESKKHILKFYSDLKKSVDDKLNAVKTDGFSVDIDSSFVLENSFQKDFLDYINKSRKGPFHGANEPEKVLRSLLNEIDWNDFESIFEFFDKILNLMRDYKGETLQIKEQATDKKDLYDFLFSLNYFSAKYELRSAGKNLNELSPGEKGLLLLVFYLQLDKDNIPLIIDQPEDNLDNDSIFAVLAKCIRQAKKNRQVILVTHNPNLAVGADAEQIVFVKLEKSENYRFTYETGSIENPNINDRIVLVLEGSQPAFVKRRLKYEI